MTEFEHSLELIGALSFIRGCVKSALINAKGEDRKHLETILEKANEGLVYLDGRQIEKEINPAPIIDIKRET
jgi:hypothetical protein